MWNNRGFTLIELIVVIALIGATLALALPTTREAFTANNLKKAARQLIGLSRELKSNAVRDHVDYILILNIDDSSYYVVTADMTAEKRQDVEKKQKRKLPGGVFIVDVVNDKDEKITREKSRIFFGKNNIGSPAVIHLGEDEDRMTIVLNPFLGLTGLYDRYAKISMDDGLGSDAAR